MAHETRIPDGLLFRSCLAPSLSCDGCPSHGSEVPCMLCTAALVHIYRSVLQLKPKLINLVSSYVELNTDYILLSYRNLAAKQRLRLA